MTRRLRRLDHKYGVSIVTSTNRPRFFQNILRNYRRQKYHRKELIIILNRNDMDLSKCRRRVRKYRGVKIYKVSKATSLGNCLNYGVSKSKYPLIAKFDDDDYYSRYYLREQVKALVRKRSHIVGKHACLVYLESTRKLVIRSPWMKNKFVSLVQGGTILFRRRVFRQVRFANTSIGEDVTFLRMSRNRGFKIYATSAYNYVYIRRKNKQSHTWKAPDRDYLSGSQRVAKTTNYRQFAECRVKL